ncbi:hypothetical protein HJFPF1_10414 [Paramyrothecium foliicola]|nr:hypothetical protein HJFPF1_10414 [Paramyrothecium foliicola]
MKSTFLTVLAVAATAIAAPRPQTNVCPLPSFLVDRTDAAPEPCTSFCKKYGGECVVQDCPEEPGALCFAQCENCVN